MKNNYLKELLNYNKEYINHLEEILTKGIVSSKNIFPFEEYLQEQKLHYKIEMDSLTILLENKTELYYTDLYDITNIDHKTIRYEFSLAQKSLCFKDVVVIDRNKNANMALILDPEAITLFLNNLPVADFVYSGDDVELGHMYPKKEIVNTFNHQHNLQKFVAFIHDVGQSFPNECLNCVIKNKPITKELEDILLLKLDLSVENTPLYPFNDFNKLELDPNKEKNTNNQRITLS